MSFPPFGGGGVRRHRFRSLTTAGVLVFCAVCFRTATALTLPTTNGNFNGNSPQTPPPLPLPPSRFVILGGTGKIGTAVAAHLSYRLSTSSSTSSAPSEIVLVGRKPSDECFEGALRDIEELVEWSHGTSNKKKRTTSTPATTPPPRISYRCVPDVWEPGALDAILGEAENDNASENVNARNTAVIHTAGPYADRTPTVLDACIAHEIPVYVDVSDPLEFLEASRERHASAVASGTKAVLAAGAFPGLSNLLALEAAAAAVTVDLSGDRDDDSETDEDESTTATKTTIKDVRFNYFTKGLGGSGTINLYITNLGFGDPIIAHDNGKTTRFDDLSGRILGTVDFFLDDATERRVGNSSSSSSSNNNNNNDDDRWKRHNARARQRIGTQKVFAWPFPEAATVASKLSIEGSSSSAMGTAPELWNDMLGLLVDLVPRSWWRSPKFSGFLADFSEPLVLATDWAMQKWSNKNRDDEYLLYDEEDPNGECGETHAMRVDVVTTTTTTTTTTRSSGKVSEEEKSDNTVSIIQCHDSFRRCVGQSCAEFALDLLGEDATATASATGGVYLPEDRYARASDRSRIVSRLVSTPGTFCYTGPVPVVSEEPQQQQQQQQDRILLKSTPTPGLLCNGAPIEVRLGMDEDEDDFSN